MNSIDLNADLGEGGDNDFALLQLISSASIACGGHAGNAETMRAALRAAKANNVTCGAHPGFVDPENFGRRRLDLPLRELQEQVVDQIQALKQIADEEGVSIFYVKLHGALANMAAEDDALAEGIFTAVKRYDANLAILALDNSAQFRAAETLGLKTIREAYADRAYLANGQLMPRSEEGAVIEEPDAVVAQCLRLAQCGEITASDGSLIKSSARSICVHGDTRDAVELLQHIKQALVDEKISVAAAFKD